jgi:hypothetical protein
MDTEKFLRSVKYNCNVSDAGAWGYYSICGLLMRLREMYLSEYNRLPWDNVPREEVSAWIQERETLWKELEGRGLEQLQVDGMSYDPFDVDGVNRSLSACGLVYGSGIGMFGKPTFFVADVEAVRELFDYRIFYSGRELCRDLSGSAAMLQGRCVYLRYDVLRSLIWDRFQMLRARRQKGLFDRLFGGYGIERNEQVSPDFAKKIDRVARDVSEIFVRHEIGEAYEDLYTEEWVEMLGAGPDKYTELFLRAIKDLLSDASSMGPLAVMIDGRNEGLVVAYMAFLEGIRKEIFPEMVRAYEEFSESGDWSPIEGARREGYAKAKVLRDEAVCIWKKGRAAEERLSALKAWLRETFASK